MLEFNNWAVLDMLAKGMPSPRDGLNWYERNNLAMKLVEDNADDFKPDFHLWLTENYHVYEAFSAYSDRVWDSGRTYYSARTIVEKMRFDTDIAEKSGEFKINDHATPDCARLYLLLNPSRVGFFKIKARK